VRRNEKRYPVRETSLNQSVALNMSLWEGQEVNS